MAKIENQILLEEIGENQTLRKIVSILPNLEAKQWSAKMAMELFVTTLPKSGNSQRRVLDLGCGTGGHSEFLKNVLGPNTDYIGLDVADSPEVNSRSSSALDIVTFDGVNIPFQDQFFDVIWSNQVFEHVLSLAELLTEVNRTLRPGGILVGGVSNLEPYHSRSIMNLTPFGLHTFLSNAHLNPEFMAPGVDGISLIERSINLRRAPEDIFLFSEFNRNVASDSSLDTKLKYWKMLKFSGHIIFVARKGY
jgi:SAM-dependent methyltransferase